MIPARGSAYALFGLAALLTTVAIVSGWRGVSRMVGREHDTAAAAAAAARFIVAVGTYDERDLASYAGRLRSMTTDALRDALADAVLDAAAVDGRRSASTTVESVSVTAGSRGVATVVVTASQLRSWSDARSGPQVEWVRQRTSCRVVRDDDDRWRVAEVRLLSEEPVRADEPR